MIIRRCSAALLFFVCLRAAMGQTYKIDPAHSKIAFSVPHLLGTARGEFHKFNGSIVVDREHPERSSVTATIQVASIDTQIPRRDTHLLSADFFDAARFPTITFRSRSVRRSGMDTGDIAGDLTLKGVTRPLTLRVKLVTPVAGGCPLEPPEFNTNLSAAVIVAWPSRAFFTWAASASFVFWSCLFLACASLSA